MGVQNTATIRFLVCLREPVERIISSVSMERFMKNPKWPEQQDKGTDEHVYKAFKSIKAADLDLSPWSFSEEVGKHHGLSHGYDSILRGTYARHLKQWTQKFPREQLLVINANAMTEYPTWKRIYDHVGLRAPEQWELKKQLEKEEEDYKSDPRWYPSEKGWKPADWLKKELNAFFEEHNTALWQMLDVNRKWW